MEKMRLAQIDPTNSIDGTTTGSPSGNGAAQDISLQSLYQRGFTPTEAVSVNSSSNDVSVVNNSNDYGGAQRVQPTNRSYYSNIELIGY